MNSPRDAASSSWTMALLGGLGAVSVAAVTTYGYYYYTYASSPRGTLPPSTQKNRTLVVAQPHADDDFTQVQLKIEERDMPTTLAPGKVLVQMHAVPVHPSDYNEWRIKSGGVGHEGCGIVVASGGGLVANRLVGKRVGVILGRSGTVTEYLVADAVKDVFVLSTTDTSSVLADCASWFVNPFTALSILDTTRNKHNTRILIQTAAASQLGQMLVKLAPRQGMTLINIVRTKEQWKLLKDLGAGHVICTVDDDWMTQLKALVKTLDIHVAFDAVSGPMTGSLVTCLPSRSTVYVYGVLAGAPVQGIDPIDLIYRRKRVLGFHMAKDWLSVNGGVAGSSSSSSSSSLTVEDRIQKNLQQWVGPGLLPGGWATSQFVDCGMDNAHEVFCNLWKNGFTGKKLRILLS